MPIYYVIYAMDRNTIKHILYVFKCDMQDINKLWKEYVSPLIDTGVQAGVDIYLREPENPFKDFKSEPQ